MAGIGQGGVDNGVWRPLNLAQKFEGSEADALQSLAEAIGDTRVQLKAMQLVHFSMLHEISNRFGIEGRELNDEICWRALRTLEDADPETGDAEVDRQVHNVLIAFARYGGSAGVIPYPDSKMTPSDPET